MKRTIRMMKVAVVLGMAVVGLVGGSALTTPVQAQGCQQPVACPAIAKLCPQGQIACRPSPCHCNFSCAPEGHGCNS